jgi:NAD(P)H-hydrate repair Nnr-like enzyme with NAD(P)H-hydrate dehydratase domain
VHVVAEEVVNKLYPLIVTPKPYEVKRFYLLFGKDIGNIPLEPLEVRQWQMTKEKTVVEWGASLYDFSNSFL